VRLIAALLLLGGLFAGAGYAAFGPQTQRAPAPPPTVYVDTTGSDKNPCTQAAPCASFRRGYRVAPCGGVVRISAGSYGKQDLASDPAKAACTQRVVLDATPAAVLTQGMKINASHLEVVGIGADFAACVTTSVAPPCPAIAIVGGTDVVLRRVRFARFFVYASNVQILSSDFGPSYDNHGIIGAPTRDLVVADTVIHDQWNSQACKAAPGCLSRNHMGCGTINDSTNVTFARNRIYNCEDLALLVKPYRGSNQNIRFENNVFGPVGGFRAVSLSVTNPAQRQNNGIHFLYNTFLKGISVSRGITYPNSEAIGNLGNLGSCTGLESGGFTLGYNVVFGSTPCGANSKVGANGSFAADGFHLLSSSPAVGGGDPENHPASDIDGQTRPRRWRPDAGADQREPADLVLGRSIGAVAIGAGEADVRAFYGAPQRSTNVRFGKKVLPRIIYRLHGGSLFVTLDAGKVVGVGSSSPYYETVGGIGPGGDSAGVKSFAGVRWVKCRGAFLRYYGNAAVYFTLRGGKAGKTLDGISMLKRGYEGC
jgi:hypothetical protein